MATLGWVVSSDNLNISNKLMKSNKVGQGFQQIKEIQ